MKLILAADFSGFALKETVKRHLEEQGHEITDVGHREDGQQVVYPEAAGRLCREFLKGGYDRGLVFCGTGAGVSITANKFRGIYCVPCESVYTALKCPVINQANVLAMGANVVGGENACKIADAWLSQSFCQDFAPERAAFIEGLYGKLQEIEAENFC
ncbi:MAG: RpiB/LacA/LacB family sugar-phosphate isomerase [Lachnospiraceae bacterium]|nr:RpiB/LacA/LacB family sugar-phosphate isomerase [Lachnospiraceae bacterium]